MNKIIKLTTLRLILMLCFSQAISLIAQPTSLPLLQIDDLEYQGAFAIPSAEPLDMSANSSSGTIAYNRANNSLFIAGHHRYGKIAEFSIPDLVNTKTDLSALNQATLLQNFSPVVSVAPSGNPQNIEVINGIALVNGKLIVNAEDRYDGEADNTHTTLVVENASNLANSAVNGFYELEGAVHAAGWMSPVPTEWRTLLGGSHIAGHAGKRAINRRYSIGPSAFVFNPADISATSGNIPTTALLDFSLENPLHADYDYENAFYNMVEVNGDASFTGHTFEDADGIIGTNDLWTEISYASYGFIIPGTRTYLTIGASGGQVSGIGYKPEQNHGYTCPGPCPYDGEDYYNYYWLWDVNDLLDVKNGLQQPHELRPYDYGFFEELFRTDENPRPWDLQTITGGTFDADNGILYLTIHDGASTNQHERLPAIVAYKINVEPTCTDADNDGVCADIDPNDNDPCVPNSCGGSECELLTNNTFDNDKSPWINWGCNVASVNGLAAVTNIQPSTRNWEIVMMQSGVPLEQGENYTVKFSARADASRPLSVVLQLDGSPYTGYFDATVNLNTNMQDYTFNFTMSDPSDDDANFMFFIGNSTVNTYIDNVSLTKTDCGGSSCSQQGQSCNDQDPCTTGETYDANCNCTGGTYTDADNDGVCIGNDPDDNDPCVPNSCGGGECELLTNNTFDNDTAPWGVWGADLSSLNGLAAISNIQSSTVPWGVGFIQRNIPVEQGEDYTVKFSARADANRPLTVLVELQGSPYTRYFETVVNLSPNMRDYTFNFTMNRPTDNNANFIFYMGGNRSNTYIDNVSLTKTDCDTPISGTCDCPAVAQPGNVVTVRNVAELRNAISQANNQNGNMTIKLEPGEYQLDRGFSIAKNMPNVTVMGTTGNRDDVFIKGQGYNGGVPAIFWVNADNFSVADLTVGEVSTHAIQIQAYEDADDFTAINVRFVDINEQMLKVSGGDGSNFSDRGRVLCCAFEFTAGIAYQFYTGGIDAHRSRDWLISNNTFDGIRSPEAGLSEHAIHMWRVCEGTIVTNNQITNCDRGIGFGLGDALGNGHTGGLIMNNFVHTNRDVGIGLEYSPGTKVYNNTVITDNYSNSIEYRFSATNDVRIINNLISGNVAQRSGAPTATTSDNYRTSDLSIFVDAANHDYHLVGRPAGIVDAGTSLSEVSNDIDCDNRTSRIDIGADEVSSGAKEDLSSASSFTLYPNPANQTIQLVAEISENTTAQIQIYDAFGKLVRQINDIELITDSPINMNIAQLPAGVYFCTLQSGEWQAVEKFIIAR